VNTQIRDIRTANSTASSFISEALPVTFVGTDAAGRPFAKDLFVALATSNVPNATPNATIPDTIFAGTSDDLKKKTENQKPFSSIKLSE
jgi:hypothetical protein